MLPAMELSEEGLNFISTQEGRRYVAYKDAGGIWTIGDGHTNGVKEGDTCTDAMADSWRRYDTAQAQETVNLLVTCNLTQGEFDALVSFVFNIGAVAFRHSTLLQKLNAGDYAGAANEFDRWDHVNGKVCQGLLRRRQLEEKEFEGAD